MAKTRLSVEIDKNEHKYLKMCCAKIGISITKFVELAVIKSVDDWETTWQDEKFKDEDATLRKWKQEQEKYIDTNICEL